MKTQLSAPLLKLLLKRGYTHCFSKTLYDADLTVSLVITPVKPNGPISQHIPAKLDSFFAIKDELLRLLNNKHTIWISLKPAILKGPAGQLLNSYLTSKTNEANINN